MILVLKRWVEKGSKAWIRRILSLIRVLVLKRWTEKGDKTVPR